MRKSQRGVTFIGWVILLVPVAIIGYAGIRLAPIFINYYRVVQAMDQEATEARTNGTQINPQNVRNGLDRRFDVGYVDHPTGKDIDIHRDGEHWVAIADYEDVAPLFGNVQMLVQFHKQVELQ
jgi:Domain of unknown function (DUF4845)